MTWHTLWAHGSSFFWACSGPMVTLFFGPIVAPQSCSSFFFLFFFLPFSWMAATVYSQVVLSAHLLSVDFWKSDSFLSFRVFFSTSWQCFCSYNILRNFVGLLYMTQGLMPLEKKVLHRYVLYNSIYIPSFCWDNWVDPWVICLISSAKGCPATTSGFSLEDTSQQ